jgi:tRNA1Val (adenine37-N6)-methyltransferase
MQNGNSPINKVVAAISTTTDAPGVTKRHRKDVEETTDALFQGNIRLVQRRHGYRFSLDAVLLAYFATVKAGEKAADLGCGNGVIALLLAALHPSVSITGIEIQSEMVARAKNNVRMNHLEQRVRILSGDVRNIGKVALPASYDVVVCNPPYRKSGSGRISPDTEKRIARHETKAKLGDFLRAGSFLLRAKGRLALVYPAVYSLDLLASMRQVGVEPKRVRMVHSFAQAHASLILVEGVKGGRNGTTVSSPLVVYESGKTYTSEVARMLVGPTSPHSSLTAQRLR